MLFSWLDVPDAFAIQLVPFHERIAPPSPTTLHKVVEGQATPLSVLAGGMGVSTNQSYTMFAGMAVGVNVGVFVGVFVGVLINIFASNTV